MPKVHLSGGHTDKFALVDESDLPLVSKHRWYLNRKYAVTFVKRRMWSMHRLIMRPREDEQVDHKNHNGLDNRRANLRKVECGQNHMNRSVVRSQTGFKGVSLSTDWKRRKPYRATVTLHRKQYRLGYFETAEEAAMAYDAKAQELFGPYAHLNFPSG